MTVSDLDPLNDPEWNQRLSTLPSATFFHTREWAQVLALTYAFPRHYYALEAGPQLQALLPVMEARAFGGKRKGVALPFSDFVTIPACSADIRAAVVAHAFQEARARNWRTLELRSGECPIVGAQPSVAHLRHEIALLPDEASMFARMKRTARTAIRKAQSQGVRVACVTDSDSLACFCKLNALTRRRHGLPPQPTRFFRAIDACLLQRRLAEIWLATAGSTPIAAAMFLIRHPVVTFKYGCSDNRFQHLRPSDLIMWRAMAAYAASGFTRMCLGRTDAAHEGLRRFKVGLGAYEETVPYFKYDVRRAAFFAEPLLRDAWYHRVFQTMPLIASRWLGNFVYKYAA